MNSIRHFWGEAKGSGEVAKDVEWYLGRWQYFDPIEWKKEKIIRPRETFAPFVEPAVPIPKTEVIPKPIQLSSCHSCDFKGSRSAVRHHEAITHIQFVKIKSPDGQEHQVDRVDGYFACKCGGLTKSANELARKHSRCFPVTQPVDRVGFIRPTLPYACLFTELTVVKGDFVENPQPEIDVVQGADENIEPNLNQLDKTHQKEPFEVALKA